MLHVRSELNNFPLHRIQLFYTKYNWKHTDAKLLFQAFNVHINGSFSIVAIFELAQNRIKSICILLGSCNLTSSQSILQFGWFLLKMLDKMILELIISV